MESMKHFAVLILCFLVNTQGIHGAEGEKADSGLGTNTRWKGDAVLASVREYPLFLHKCTATFLTPKYLLTTASCLTCADDCSLYVRIHSKYLTNTEKSTGMTYLVHKRIMYPDYEIHPRFNDVGIIVLKESARDPYVYALPKFAFNPADTDASVFSWQFNSALSEYTLYDQNAKVISNKLCSTYLHRYVNIREICILFDQPFSLGPFDHGSPIIGSVNGTKVILGTFVETGYVHNARIIVYQSIIPHMQWIRSTFSGKDDVLPPPPPYSTTAPSNGQHDHPAPATNGGHNIPQPPAPNQGQFISQPLTSTGGLYGQPPQTTYNGGLYSPPSPTHDLTTTM